MLGIMALVALFAAAGAAVYLFYDDWQTWMKGGKSAFGDFYQYVADHWSDIKGVVTSVLSELKKLWHDYTAAISDELKLFVALFFGSADDIRNSWKKVVGDIKTFWSDMWDGLVRGVEYLGPKLMGGLKSAFDSAFGYLINRINTIWHALGNKGDLIDTSAPPTGIGGVVSGGLAAVGSRGVKPVDRAQYEKDIQYLMKKHGLSREDAVAMVAGGEARESQGDMHAVGDNGQAYGLFQWHPPRQAEFERVFGKKMQNATREEQLDFAVYEVKTHPEYAAFLKAKSQEEKAAMFVIGFERPKHAEQEAMKAAGIAKTLQNPPPPLFDALAQAVNTATKDSYAPGAPSAAEFAASNDNSRNIHSEVHIHEQNIHTQATDAKGIAKDIKPALERDSYAATANYGYR
jgi:hypothetical protein